LKRALHTAPPRAGGPSISRFPDGRMVLVCRDPRRRVEVPPVALAGRPRGGDAIAHFDSQVADVTRVVVNHRGRRPGSRCDPTAWKRRILL
jgi:hypothetical protein